jgi:quercetin dioxygenase-like cupin family protein
MEIKKSSSQPSNKRPEEYFTGTVCVDPLFDATTAARVLGASVTFEPGEGSGRGEKKRHRRFIRCHVP